MASFSFDVYFLAMRWLAAAIKSSNTFCFFSNIPALCHSSPYSPLHNIRSGVEYPATMIVTADHDDRVVPAHSFKYTATLQDKYKGKNPILLKIDTNSGHGYSSIVKNIELASDIYSFILFNMNALWKDVE